MNKIKFISLAASVSLAMAFTLSCDIDAKRKAQEVSPAAGTWQKLQWAYALETGSVSSNDKIGYTPPESKYFRYESGPVSANTAVFRATLKESLGGCKDGVWTVTFTYNADGTAKTKAEITGAGCEELTPRFKEIQ